MFSLALSLWAASCTSRAADDSAAFLDAMRATGNYDLTLEYLDLLSASDRTTAETRDRLPYERAVTRLEQAQTISSPSAREASVTSARRELQEFISGGNEPRLAAEASVKLAGALVNGAGRRVQAAERQSEGTQQTEAEQARRDIQDARQYLTQSEELYQQALDAFKSVQPGSPEAKQRLQLRFELAQARLANARALSELAETYQQGSAERKQTLENAAKEFASLYEKYDTPQSAGIGFYAHLYEGRCYQALGEHRLADGCFEVVASLPTDDPSLSRLVRMAQASLVAGLVAQEKPDEALQRGAEWLEDVTRKEQSQPEVLSLKHQLGEAALLAAGTTDDQGESRELLNQARSYFTAASRGFNENQSDARLRLASLNDELGASQLEAATFQEAYQVGIDALNAVFASQLAAKAGHDVDASESSKQQHNARALDAFRQALRLADSETPLTRLNDARNKLSYLYWESGDYLSSAALAEFLATKHPDDPAAEGAAKLAMASFEKLRIEAEQAGEPTDFASDHLVRLSEFITRRWAGEPLADSAFSVLLATAIRDNRLEDARRVLEGVDPERRAPLELRLALANWEQIARNGDSTATPGERSQAINELESAYQAVRERGIVNATSATGALFLAQAKLSEGHADAAAKLLEDPKLGPLTLAQQDAPAITDNAGLKAESYRTALQAYLSITPPRTADALAMMETLESAVQDKAALTRIYFGLGVQLQRQIEQLNQAGKTADAQRVSSAFAEFVSRIGDAGDDADWTMQQWMAQTYLKLGQGLDEGDTEHRQEFFERARDGFQALADRAATDPSSAPSPNSGLAVRMQLGAALRGLGQYDKAIEVFAGLLAEREMMLDVQKLAAYTLQEWGDTGDAQHLQESIAGASKSPNTGKNLIWGWSKLASVSGKVARSKPEYRALFFESWLNVATSRYLAGMKASGEKKSKQLASARKTILLLSRQYSDLGGAEMRNQFDTLLKKIQRAQGEKPVGLAEFTTALLTTPEPRPTGANA